MKLRLNLALTSLLRLIALEVEVGRLQWVSRIPIIPTTTLQ